MSSLPAGRFCLGAGADLPEHRRAERRRARRSARHRTYWRRRALPALPRPAHRLLCGRPSGPIGVIAVAGKRPPRAVSSSLCWRSGFCSMPGLGFIIPASNGAGGRVRKPARAWAQSQRRPTRCWKASRIRASYGAMRLPCAYLAYRLPDTARCLGAARGVGRLGGGGRTQLSKISSGATFLRAYPRSPSLLSSIGSIAELYSTAGLRKIFAVSRRTSCVTSATYSHIGMAFPGSRLEPRGFTRYYS